MANATYKPPALRKREAEAAAAAALAQQQEQEQEEARARIIEIADSSTKGPIPGLTRALSDDDRMTELGSVCWSRCQSGGAYTSSSQSPMDSPMDSPKDSPIPPSRVPAERACPEGLIEVDVENIVYSQDVIYPTFCSDAKRGITGPKTWLDHLPLQVTIDALREGTLDPADLPPIEVAQFHGLDVWISFNNRRLYCFKEAGVRTIFAKQVACHLYGGSKCKQKEMMCSSSAGQVVRLTDGTNEEHSVYKERTESQMKGDFHRLTSALDAVYRPDEQHICVYCYKNGEFLDPPLPSPSFDVLKLKRIETLRRRAADEEQKRIREEQQSGTITRKDRNAPRPWERADAALPKKVESAPVVGRSGYDRAGSWQDESSNAVTATQSEPVQRWRPQPERAGGWRDSAPAQEESSNAVTATQSAPVQRWRPQPKAGGWRDRVQRQNTDQVMPKGRGKGGWRDN